MGDAFGCGAGTGDGSGEADVVGGDGAGIGFAVTGVCGVALGFGVDEAGVVCVTVVACVSPEIASGRGSAASADAPHKKTGTRIPESWRNRRRFKRITQTLIIRS